MIQATIPLVLGAVETTTQLQFSRLADMTAWWHWPVFVLACAAMLGYVIYMYARDSVELAWPVTTLLLVLRIFTVACLVFLFLGLEKRTKQEFTKDSRVVVLVDTSQSMGLSDSASTAGPAGPSRIDLAASAFQEGHLINALRRDHEVVVARFAEKQKPTPVASFPRLVDDQQPQDIQLTGGATVEQRIERFRTLAITSVGLFAGAAFFCLVYLTGRFVFRMDGLGWTLLPAVVLTVACLITAAVACLADPRIIQTAANQAFFPDSVAEDSLTAGADESDEEDEDRPPAPAEIDWKEELKPQGTETRIGDNVIELVNRERGGSIAGVVLISDGGNNAGVDHTDAIAVARDADIPVYTVGLGSAERPPSVRVVDVEVPKRVYPKDTFTITGFVQAFELDGSVQVELRSSPYQGAGAERPSPDDAVRGDLEDAQKVELGKSGRIVPVTFELTPEEEDIGRWVYTLRIVGDIEDTDRRDNYKSAHVEVVERRNRVLLLADGPTREYRFVRNLLFREGAASADGAGSDDATGEPRREAMVDVYLQSAPPGISQESDNILDEFPSTEEELFENYDCIVAFDPDWLALSANQLNLLERWVAEKAGGLVMVGGRIHTPAWAQRRRGDPRLDLLQGLSPVEIDSRQSRSQFGSYGATQSAELIPTEEGVKAEFLWLGDDMSASEATWATFDGVYGHFDSFGIRAVKPGAVTYLRFADPEQVSGGKFPPYMVGQFYGAGRVLFVASGEMWRLRSLDPNYFDTLYTKIIRHASEGRLLRESSRGLLMVSKDRCMMGETITVRAQLYDARHQPLDMPEVPAVLVQPDGTQETLTLRKVRGTPRQGLFAGQFVALQENDYRVELLIPDSQNELLVREVRVRVPRLEVEQPERKDDVLKPLAESTGGAYRVGLRAALGGAGASPVAAMIDANRITTALPDILDDDFQRLLSMWLLAAIAGALSLEWIIRRLSKLA